MQGVRHLARALGELPERMALRSGEANGALDGAGHKRFWAGVLSTMLVSGPENIAAQLRSTGGMAQERELRDARLAMALRRYEMSV
ncbi:MAG: hypothetical protein AAB426_15300 [Myxococcota bacterium]